MFEKNWGCCTVNNIKRCDEFFIIFFLYKTRELCRIVGDKNINILSNILINIGEELSMSQFYSAL